MKKENIFIAIVAVIIVVLTISVFVMSSDDEILDRNVILKIEDTEYNIAEFEKFVAIKNEENGDIAAELSAEEMDSMIQDFTMSKIYANIANSNGILVPDEERENLLSVYQGKEEHFKAYGISSGDYLRYGEDSYKENHILNNFSTYYELPEKYYNEYIEQYSGDKKTYSYRIMMFNYEEPESGEEVSGDVIESGEEDRSRETVLTIAESTLEKAKNSGDFEALAKEYASSRITFTGNSYTIVNGELEYSITPILSGKIGNEDLYNAILATGSGEFTEIIEDEEGNTLQFAKVESVEDGFVGQADKEFREALLSAYSDVIVTEGVDFEINQSALMRVWYQ